MRYLILSDIHANWEALEAALEDAAGAYDRIACLGDLVGYGPDPNRVVEWVRANVHVTVRGNHDRACVSLEGIEDFSSLAKLSAVWTHRKLSQENADYLRQLPQGPLQTGDGFTLVHGSPRDEDEYLVDVGEAADAFPYVEAAVTFFGHTHLQGGFEARKGRVRSIETGDGTTELAFEADADYLVNPGSVGQPRDGKPGAAYLLFTTGTGFLTYRRARYNVEITQKKIREGGLPAALATRLGYAQ